MAQAPGQNFVALARGFNQLSNARKIGLIVGLAAVVALAVVLLLYTRTPEYRVLFANISERDGGAIVAALSQLNVPYKMAEGGGAILVPAEQVYETRLKLAAQGLPKGAGVGFEVMEAQKFGTSQFLEQVNYQRAVEGELGRTIASIAAVQSARVHLAIPRPSVFIRETQKPSASVFVSVYPGRTLDAAQVSGIVHLVSSSVPELSPRQVTVIDQAGTLLSGPTSDTQSGALDAAQLKYLHQVEAAIAQRIENILRPITGPENVRAQVAATLDFSQVEQTSETFKPNSNPRDQAVRSQQSSESASTTPQAAQGVPGALSNQPPGAASAPLVAPTAGQAGAASPPPASSSQKEQTVNFEVDKTIRHTKGEVGAIQRLSVAVVVNYRRVVEAGAARLQPLTEQEMAQVTDLVREAMGFNKERGDTVNVVNAPFQGGVEAEPAAELPLWKDPANVALAKDIGKTLLVAIVAFYLFFGVLRPTLRDLVRLGQPPVPLPAGAGAAGGAVPVGEGAPAVQPPPSGPGGAAEAGYESDLRAVREMAKQDPRIVAQVVKDWVTRDE
jgi:flagellar M-ring protein FliF